MIFVNWKKKKINKMKFSKKKCGAEEKSACQNVEEKNEGQWQQANKQKQAE